MSCDLISSLCRERGRELQNVNGVQQDLLVAYYHEGKVLCMLSVSNKEWTWSGIFSFNKNLLSTFCKLDTVLSSGVMTKIDNLFSERLYLTGEGTDTYSWNHLA